MIDTSDSRKKCRLSYIASQTAALINKELLTQSTTMPKIPDCNRCSLYAHNPHLVCAVHPFGVETDKCMDFRLDPNAQIEEQWCPQSYSWYGDELISNRPSRYSQSEQLEILRNHPFFTGVCPQCRHEFNRDNHVVHYDCPECGWIDDSI